MLCGPGWPQSLASASLVLELWVGLTKHTSIMYFLLLTRLMVSKLYFLYFRGGRCLGSSLKSQAANAVQINSEFRILLFLSSKIHVHVCVYMCECVHV